MYMRDTFYSHGNCCGSIHSSHIIEGGNIKSYINKILSSLRLHDNSHSAILKRQRAGNVNSLMIFVQHIPHDVLALVL